MSSFLNKYGDLFTDHDAFIHLIEYFSNAESSSRFQQVQHLYKVEKSDTKDIHNFTSDEVTQKSQTLKPQHQLIEQKESKFRARLNDIHEKDKIINASGKENSESLHLVMPKSELKIPLKANHSRNFARPAVLEISDAKQSSNLAYEANPVESSQLNEKLEKDINMPVKDSAHVQFGDSKNKFRHTFQHSENQWDSTNSNAMPDNIYTHKSIEHPIPPSTKAKDWRKTDNYDDTDSNNTNRGEMKSSIPENRSDFLEGQKGRQSNHNQNPKTNSKMNLNIDTQFQQLKSPDIPSQQIISNENEAHNHHEIKPFMYENQKSKHDGLKEVHHQLRIQVQQNTQPKSNSININPTSEHMGAPGLNRQQIFAEEHQSHHLFMKHTKVGLLNDNIPRRTLLPDDDQVAWDYEKEIKEKPSRRAIIQKIRTIMPGRLLNSFYIDDVDIHVKHRIRSWMALDERRERLRARLNLDR